jgi:hypothetical protein
VPVPANATVQVHLPMSHDDDAAEVTLVTEV